MDRSLAVEAHVQRWVERLERAYGRLLECATRIELPHRHNRKGNVFSVHVEVAVPGRTLVVTKDADDAGHENVYIAIADAFRAARRQLRDHASLVRGDVKLHA